MNEKLICILPVLTLHASCLKNNSIDTVENISKSKLQSQKLEDCTTNSNNEKSSEEKDKTIEHEKKKIDDVIQRSFYGEGGERMIIDINNYWDVRHLGSGTATFRGSLYFITNKKKKEEIFKKYGDLKSLSTEKAKEAREEVKKNMFILKNSGIYEASVGIFLNSIYGGNVAPQTFASKIIKNSNSLASEDFNNNEAFYTLQTVVNHNSNFKDMDSITNVEQMIGLLLLVNEQDSRRENILVTHQQSLVKIDNDSTLHRSIDIQYLNNFVKALRGLSNFFDDITTNYDKLIIELGNLVNKKELILYSIKKIYEIAQPKLNMPELVEKNLVFIEKLLKFLQDLRPSYENLPDLLKEKSHWMFIMSGKDNLWHKYSEKEKNLLDEKSVENFKNKAKELSNPII